MKELLKRTWRTWIILIILTVCAFQCSAQGGGQIITLGVDPKLAIVGAYEDDPTPVAHIHFSWLTSLEKWEAGTRVSYANLKPYAYFDMGFLYNRKIFVFNTEAVETLVGAELGLIVRQYPLYETQKIYLDYGINTEVRFWLSDWFGFYTKLSAGPRNDLDYYGPHQLVHFDVETGVKFRF